MKNLFRFAIAAILSATSLQTNLFAQIPANDLICSAIPLSVGLGCVQGTNVNATSTGSPAAATCWVPNNTSNDVWYSFVATVRDITVSTDFSGLTLTNSQVAVYSSSTNNCNGTLTQVGCGENGGTNQANNSLIDLTLTVGNTYFIRVEGNGTSTGTFCIAAYDTYTPGSTACEAQHISPNNEPCSLNGFGIPQGGNYITNSTNPAAAYQVLGTDYPGCDNETNQLGTWLVFTATTASMTLSNKVNAVREYTLFSGTCTALSWVSCTQVASNGTANISGLTVGTEYYLLVTLPNSDGSTNFRTDLCLTNTVSCTPPANDNCANAMVITANTPYYVSDMCANPDSPPQLCSGGIQNNIWFSWTVPANWTGQAFFQIFQQNCRGGDLSTGMQCSVYSAGVVCGSTANCVTTSNTGVDNNINAVWTPVPGSTYLIQYDGNGGEVCEMNFQITSTVSPVVITVNSETICEGECVTLTATSPATGYIWSTGQTGSSIQVCPTTTTTYSVSATAGGTGVAQGTVTVNPIPAAPTAGSNSPVCAGATLNLTASTIANATYSWTGPNGFTSASQNPSIPNVTTAATGTYEVVATVLNCESDPGVVNVTVNAIPPAPTASSNSPICAGSDLNLTATSTGSGTFSWTGPNGFTSNVQNPVITGATTAASGTYSVTQTLQGCTSAPGTTQVVVNAIPVVTAGSNSPVCLGGTLNLTATVTGIGFTGTYSWTGPNGFTSTQQNPTLFNVTTDAGGNYEVIVTANGCTSLPSSVTVIISPNPAPTAGSNSPICAGQTLNLTASNIAGATYTWTGPSGFSSNLQNPSITNATTAASGTYYVTAQISGCGTSRPDSVVVVVNPLPSVTASSNSPVCEGGTINLSATTVAGASYSWTGPNGFSSSLQNPTISNATPAMSGTYTVTSSANGCAGNTPSSTTVTVVATTPPVAGNNGPVCSGATLNLTATTIAGATYSWTGPNGFTSNLQNPTIPNATTANSGTYSVVATLNGCASSAPATTNAVVNPIPGITASNNSPICAGQTLNLFASTFAGATYSWTGPNGFTSSVQNPTIPAATPAASGTYFVTATATGCSSTQPASTVATVNAIPPAPVASSNSPICEGGTINLFASNVANANYTWTGPLGFISLVQNPTIPNAAPNNSGVYTVRATVNGCISAPGTTTVIVNGTPTTPVASSNSPVCEGATINLFSTPVAGGAYSWTGPNGFTSSLQNPTIPNSTLANSGTYSVAVTINGCSGTAGTTDVVVNEIPPSPIPSSNSPVCVGGTLLLFASTVPNATYLWTDPIGFTNTNQNPVVPNITLLADGIYTVVAIVNGCVSVPATIDVEVTPVPTVSFTSNAPVCAGQPVNFTNTGSTGTAYFWDFGADATPATSTLENPTGIIYATGGVKTIIFSITTPGCSASDTETIVITNAPVADFTSDAPVCFPPGIVNFTDLSVGAVTYFWDFGAGAVPPTSTSANPGPVTFPAIGTYSVMLTVGSGGCFSTTTKTVDVGIVGADFTSSVEQNGEDGCLGHGENFYNIGSSGSGAQHFWNFGAGAVPATSTDENPTNIVYTTTGAKIITHTVIATACGTSATVTHIITINPVPAASFTSIAPVCANTPVDFTNTGSTGNGFSYQWDFGAGASPSGSTAPSPQGVLYSTSGNKTVAFTITNEFNCVAEITQTILINSAPVASFNSTAPQCTNLPVDFVNTGTATANTEWNWDFGVGANPANSVVQNPGSTTYLTAGSKTVTLTATDTVSGCSSVAIQSFVIYQSPTAAFITNAPQCSAVGIDFTNIGSSGSSWAYTWTFGTGAVPSISTAENPSDVMYTSGGTKTITFTVNDQNCTQTQTQTIVVDETPAVNITSTAPQCSGVPIDFYNSGTSTDINWSWSFGGDATPTTSNDQNPAGVVFATGGLKTVTVTATNSITGCSTTASYTFTVHQSPTASFTSNAPQCSTVPIDFTNTGSTGAQWTYIWSLGVGANPATSSAENPAGVTYSSSGSKTVTFTITDNFCSNSSTQTIVINETPKAEFVSTAPQCTGSEVDFTNLGTGANVTWAWDFGADAVPATSTDQNPSDVVYSTAGIKTVTLTTTEITSGCAVSVSHTIIIYQAPTASFTSTAPQCANVPIDFTNTGSTGSGWSYSWNLGTGANPATSASENVTGVTYSSSGTKTVTFTISNQQCVQTVSQNIVINSTPTADFVSTAPRCTGLGIDFTNLGTSAGVSWSWDFGSGATPATSTDQNPGGIIYSTSGVKSITLTITDILSGCTVSVTNTFNIYQSPTATFTSNAPQCTNTSVDFTNTGSSGTSWSYSWNFGAGASPATSVAESPNGVTYSTSGTKTITFTISDQNCTQTEAQTIVINPTPIVSFVSSAPQCTGVPVDFGNTGTSLNTIWAWDFGADATPSTSTEQHPFGVLFANAGLHAVILTAQDTTSGCTVTIFNPLMIYQTPTATFSSTAPQCANTSIDFTNTGSTGGNWAYFWNLGTGANPATSTAESPAGVTYSSSGTKTITFTISDQHCTQTSTQTITINATPVASFVSTAPQCTEIGVDFINTGTVSGVSWSWNFGLGATPSTSTTQDQSGVIYTSAGTKTVTLTTTDLTSGCSVTATNTFTIHQTPAASFTSTAPQCVNTGVNFTNTGSTGSNWSYLWTLGLGATPSVSTAENPSGVWYSSSGTKTVTLTIADQFCTRTVSQTIEISETPVANFTSTAPQCTGLPVNFTNTGTKTGVAWSWDLGSGAAPATSADENPSGVTYSTSGTKTVTLTTTNLNTSCASSVTQTINIHQSPTATFTSNAPQCANVGINFTNTGSSGNNWSYNWDFGQDAIPATSVAQNPGGVLYNSGGTKTISFTISDANCTSTQTQTITINDLPVADAGVDVTICANRSTQIGSATVSGNTYSWFPTTTLDNPFIADPTASPVAPVTNYIVTVVNTATGCINTDVVTVTMLGPLSANAGPDVSICANQSVQIGAGLIEGQFYNWSPPDGLNSTTSPNPVASPTQTTTYTLVITDTSGCDAVTDDVTVTVHSLPTADAGPDDTITHGASVQLTGTGGIQFSWSPADGLSNAGIFNPVASPDSTTTYILTVTDLFGCSNTDTVEIVVYQYAAPFWVPSAFTPDANGHNDVFIVRGTTFTTFEFSIYNRYGELIFISKDMAVGWDGKNQFTSDEVPADAYVYKIRGVLVDGEKVDVKGLVNLIK